MKKIYSYIFVLMIVLPYSSMLYGQANTTLSNLVSPTSVNQSLLPNADNARELGSATKGWRKLYLDSAIYMVGSKFIHYGTNTTLGVTAIGFSVLSSNSSYAN